jgi:replicative DNA helicase
MSRPIELLFDAMPPEDQLLLTSYMGNDAAMAARCWNTYFPKVRGEKLQKARDWQKANDPQLTDGQVLVELSAARACGGGAVLDSPEVVESVWGDGHRSLWAVGEPFLICGPDGVGKTTLSQQLTLHRAGVLDSEFLGLPVQAQGRVLYLACDRPTQAMRSLRRMVSADDRELLDANLTIWRGPLPFNLVTEPRGLVELAHYFDAQTVVVDSLKDVASDLSKEESGLGLNMAFQNAVAEGIEVCALHHQRKQQTGASKPRHLSDVYGSRWITAGAGSVVMLWAEAGDLVVDFDQLKQPDETVGPFKILHDHVFGVSVVAESMDAWTVVQGAGRGITATTVATALFETPTPDRNQVEKARRQLERLFREKKISKREGTKGGRGGGDAALYAPRNAVLEVAQ